MYIGIDIGGTSIKAALVDSKGRIIQRSNAPTVDDKEIFLESLKKIIINLSEKAKIDGLGISIPGIVSKTGKLTTAGAIKSLYGFNLKKWMEEQFAKPVVILNDGNSAALSEKWLGNAKEISNYLCMVIGTGIGGGIVLNNELFYGSHGSAGEFGWMIMNQIPISGDIEPASLNFHGATILGLCRKYNELMSEKKDNFDSTVDAKIVFQHSETNSEVNRIVEQFYTDLAIGLLNLVSLFDPEKILIGGGISNNEIFMQKLTTRFNTLKNRHGGLNKLSKDSVATIETAHLKNDAGLLGAVYQVIKFIEDNPYTI